MARSCGSGLLGRPVSESGSLRRHGDGDHEGSSRCREEQVLTILLPILEREDT
jgi:hypothetical protein